MLALIISLSQAAQAELRLYAASLPLIEVIDIEVPDEVQAIMIKTRK